MKTIDHNLVRKKLVEIYENQEKKSADVKHRKARCKRITDAMAI
jgi:hypothetical protein